MNDIFDKVAELSETNFQKNPYDFFKDGLLYCGLCHTKKTTLAEVPEIGRSKVVSCLCECEKKKRDDEERERRGAAIVELRRRECFGNGKAMQWTFAADDGKQDRIKNAMRKYADNFEEMQKQGRGLLLYGNVGAGKSFYAACIAHVLIDKFYTARMIDFGEIEKKVQSTWNGREELFDQLISYDFLILDDLGAERDSEYMQQIVYDVINARYKAGLPLIVTTNLSSDELKNPADMKNSRIYSRILEMCLPVKFEGGDKRREKLKEYHKPMTELLGL